MKILEITFNTKEVVSFENSTFRFQGNFVIVYLLNILGNVSIGDEHVTVFPLANIDKINYR